MKCVPRCKLGRVHCAWWLIGFEDDPNQSCEIDIFEILGTDVNRIWSTVHSWKDSTIQYHTEHPWFATKKLAEEFHVIWLRLDTGRCDCVCGWHTGDDA